MTAKFKIIKHKERGYQGKSQETTQKRKQQQHTNSIKSVKTSDNGIMEYFFKYLTTFEKNKDRTKNMSKQQETMKSGQKYLGWGAGGGTNNIQK